LKLNTGRPFSHLPNRPYPKGTPMFPTADDVVAHLDRHAHEAGIELRLGAEAQRVERLTQAWRVRTSAGDIDAARWSSRPAYITRRPSAVAWCRRIRQHGPLVAVPQPGAVSGQEGAGRRHGFVGIGNRARSRDRGSRKVWLAVRTPPNILLRSLPGGLSADLIAVQLHRMPVSDR